MGISHNGQFNDVNNDDYVAASLNVTTTEVEAKVGANRLAGRELIIIENQGPGIVRVGPSGVDANNGIRLSKNQTVALPVGDAIAIYLITESSIASVVVQEIA